MLRHMLPMCVVLGLVAIPALAQTLPSASPAAARLRVFLDCSDCFPDFLREEIRWVDFVRQPQDAEVHVLTRSSETGGGGRELALRFVGNLRFKGVDQELKAVSLPSETEDTRRRNVLRVVTVGLLGYLAREGLPGDVVFSVKAPRPDAAAAPVRDPWNFWVFSVEAGASVQAEETERQWDWSADLTADRVTERWKLNFGASLEHETEEFDLDEDQPLRATRRERTAEGFVARALGAHWSAGFIGAVESSTFDNIKFQAAAAPTIEFNVFPYAEYATRQLRLEYLIGAERSMYNEITLYDKFSDTLGRHEFQATLDQRQPWGTLQAFVEFGQYLHDFGKYRLESGGEISIRIARGLSLNVEGSASRVRDQISLPRRDATQEEVLLRLRELQSGFEVDVSIGLTYTFGSIFNNIVNPRFGR